MLFARRQPFPIYIDLRQCRKCFRWRPFGYAELQANKQSARGNGLLIAHFLAAKISGGHSDRRTVHNQIFFTNVLRLLDEQGMTKTELAERAEISVSFLSDLTNGKANPSLKIMEAIADALHASLPALIEMTDLDQEALAALAGNSPPSSLPRGYVRVSVILTEFQAFMVKQWDQENRKNMHRRRKASKV